VPPAPAFQSFPRSGMSPGGRRIVATAPKLKPAKAAGKLNPLPAVVGAPSETAQKQTEANDQSLATVLHASRNLREKWRVSTKPVRTHKLPTAAELVSQQLRVEVTSLLKTFGRRRFYNIEELKEAAEWKRLRDLFRVAGKDYATVSRGERDRLARVKEKIRSDRCAIAEGNAARVFRILQIRRSDFGIEPLRSAYDTKFDSAMHAGMLEAEKVCIAESEISHRNRRAGGRPLGMDDSHSESTRPLPAYRSPAKRAFMSVLLHATAPNDLSDLQLCRLADEEGATLPDDWQTPDCITFGSAYNKKSTAIHSAANKVRTDLRIWRARLTTNQ
jgi:hypothetical protein